jgi:hypothetical protein
MRGREVVDICFVSLCVNDTQGERRADSCYGWNRSSAPPCGAGGKSRRVATNGASGRFELDWRWERLGSSLIL